MNKMNAMTRINDIKKITRINENIMTNGINKATETKEIRKKGNNNGVRTINRENETDKNRKINGMNIINLKIFLILGFAFVLFILLSSSVFALGVTPGRTTLNLEPGADKSFSFTIINSEEKYMDLLIVVEGDLNQSITLSDYDFRMEAGELSKKINVEMRMPLEMSPGTHNTKILIVEKAGASSGQTQVGSVVGVISEINVLVPYPWNYVDAAVNVIGPDEEGEMTFVIPIINRGVEAVQRAIAVIDVYDKDGIKVASIKTNEAAIPASKRMELIGTMKKNLPFGNYNLSASIDYDGNILKIERLFAIGEPLLDLQKISVSDYKLGGIAKFEMIVDNKWNDEIKNVYSKMKIYNNFGGVLAEFASSSQNMPALGRATFVSYWDSIGVEKGTYDSVVTLNYEQRSTVENFKIDVSDNKIDIVGISYVISGGATKTSNSEKLVIILVIAIAVMAVLNTIWFLIIRRRMARRLKHENNGVIKVK